MIKTLITIYCDSPHCNGSVVIEPLDTLPDYDKLDDDILNVYRWTQDGFGEYCSTYCCNLAEDHRTGQGRLFK